MAVLETKTRSKFHSQLEWLGNLIAKRDGFTACFVSHKLKTKNHQLHNELQLAKNRVQELEAAAFSMAHGPDPQRMYSKDPNKDCVTSPTLRKAIETIDRLKNELFDVYQKLNTVLA